MFYFKLLALFAIYGSDLQAAEPYERVKLTPEARKIHAQSYVIDGHNDLPWALHKKEDMELKKYDIRKNQPDFHTDIPRLKLGGVGAQFWSAYVPARSMFDKKSVKMTLEQIDLIHRLVEKYPDTFEFAYSTKDIARIRAKGKIASLIGVEGGHSIANSLGVLRSFYRLGVRYMTLTHSLTLDWADSATDTHKHNGLTKFGRDIINEMNRLGMFIDISHVSAEVMRAAIKQSRAPVIASHSSAKAVADHARNVPDDVLKLIKKNGGVIMVNFYSGFTHPKAAITMKEMFSKRREFEQKFSDQDKVDLAYKEWKKQNPIEVGDVKTIADHIEHIIKIAGIDHVGYGGDYDGVDYLPHQLEDVSGYPYLTQELLNRGYKAKDIHKIMSGNLISAMKRMEKVSQKSPHSI
jgi:membrane dipeptidase